MIQLQLFIRGQVVFQHPLPQSLELGRQRTGEPPAPSLISLEGNRQRLILAGREESSIGREQLQIDLIHDHQVRLTNLNKTSPIALEKGEVLLPGESRLASLPLFMQVGPVVVKLEDEAVSSAQFHSLAEPTGVFAGQRNKIQPQFPSLVSAFKNHDSAGIFSRLQRLVEVLQLAASSPAFLEEVAVATCELVDLDHAAVLFIQEGTWTLQAESSRAGRKHHPWHHSQTLLARVDRERRTFWLDEDKLSTEQADSLATVTGAVAAPILNASGEVKGAIYGVRSVGSRAGSTPLGPLDAQLIEILATGVAGGLIRLEHERASIARRIQLEQFVTPAVARQLDEDPAALLPRDATVTLLFCDIVGFSRISERLTTQQTFAWINDVMEVLSTCILQQGGTLVDYVGDELIAMWGAPYPNDEHAAAACHAAQAMVQSMNELNVRWQDQLQDVISVGIGLNSGVVGVGNTGSGVKLKYGPLGSQVNIASRVQSATRFFQTSILVTEATAALVGSNFPMRRLSRVRLRNIEQPIHLYELLLPAEGATRLPEKAYEKALASWEQGEVADAFSQLESLMSTGCQDGPAKVLLKRCREAMTDPTDLFDPVWQM